MKDLNLHVNRSVVPMIYCYTTPGVDYHEGWVKIGDTEQLVEDRIKEQTYTPDIHEHIEWSSEAVFDDGSGRTFRDYDFHKYLALCGIEKIPGKGKEWFHIDPDKAHDLLISFKEGKGYDPAQFKTEPVPYQLRPEQKKAVDQTAEYYENNPGGKYLWNAKPRFGKTLSVYEFCRKVHARKVLIVTNRPVVVTSWYNDYVKFARGWQEGYYFASDSNDLKKYVMSSNEISYYVTTDSALLNGSSYFTFISLQDLKGSLYFGGQFNKLKHIRDTKWDVLVIDESHEGVDTFKTDTAFDHLDRNFTLYLSGTPFKALASREFASDQIFNWTYVDEQEAKRNWHGLDRNPYEEMPTLNLYTYKMSDIVRDEVKQGPDMEEDGEDYAFDLNEFFALDESGHFRHLPAVKQFIKALTTQKKFPFSTPELRNEMKHTLWLMDRVESAKELARLLQNDPTFENYEIIPAVGDGRLDDDDEKEKAFDKVMDAIHGNKKKGIEPSDKTITISVGQLTTGVTVPEWSGVLILSNVASSALYMQAAFRAQNPCLISSYSKKEHKRVFLRKQNAYVFDFDPARTLDLYENFANGLYSSTADGHGTLEERTEHIKKLLNFFPVIGEDPDGEMVPLDAEKVLSIPRKIRSREVVRHGFMSNFLFQNISRIFAAPKAVADILNQFQPVAQQKDKKQPIPTDAGSDLDLDEDGNVGDLSEFALGTAADLFGDKKYEEAAADAVNRVFENTEQPDQINKQINDLKKTVYEQAVKPIVNDIQADYAEKHNESLKASDRKNLENIVKSQIDRAIDKQQADFDIKTKENNAQREEELQKSESKEQDAAINQKYDDKLAEITQQYAQDLNQTLTEAIHQSQTDGIEHVERRSEERKKDSFEDDVRARLRGFARTIPAFLMAYGSDNDVTLQNFDQIIPDDVFLEVTNVTLEQFRFLRDGGDYTADDGSTQHFKGELFDPVVFNDSVKEFMSTKKKLADYFNENNKEDIFDYIPNQKNNQIFTPRPVVREMVDLLEKENPGCFDRDDKTFVDLYMKSGMYITEIVKRLYNSDAMKAKYPDGKDRLVHIFGKQVYGLAPTEIIYRIATNYIFGFSDEISVPRDHFRKLDALELAKDGTLEQKLEEMFPDLKDRED